MKKSTQTYLTKYKWLCAIGGMSLFFCFYICLNLKQIAIFTTSTSVRLKLIQLHSGIFFANPNTKTCTISKNRCFDGSKCEMVEKSFMFSIYPTNLLKVGSNEPSDFFLNFISALKKSSHFTENVNEACFLIPHFDHTLVHSQALHPFRVGALLRQLPHWNEGRNHLLLNKNDFPTVEFNFGYAMVAKVGWSDRYYRPLFDISLPPPLPWLSGDRKTRPFGGLVDLERPRKFLAVFRGAPTHRLRSKLATLHNGEDIIVELLPSLRKARAELRASGGPGVGGGGGKPVVLRSLAGLPLLPETYAELMLRTTFALCPRGNGLYSYRLVEAMAAGALPVVLANDYVPPFPDLLNISSFVLVVPEQQLSVVPDMLRRIPHHEIKVMRVRMRRAFKRYFATFNATVDSMLRSLRLRLKGVN